MMTRANAAKKLKGLMAAKGDNEVECGRILKEPANVGILIPHYQSFVATRDAELRTPAGDVDLLVVGEEIDAGGKRKNILYVWELKAAQRPPFEVLAPTRAQPTKELYSAENQLIHYYREIRGSSTERANFGVLSEEDVRLGGIIIGRDGSGFWKGTGKKGKKVVATDAARLAIRAMDARRHILYGDTRIRLLTWDWVIRELERVTVSHSVFTTAGDVDPGIGPVITGSATTLDSLP